MNPQSISFHPMSRTHSRTPSLISNGSEGSSSPEPEEEEVLIDRHDLADDSVADDQYPESEDLDVVGFERRPRLIRTISLPITPPTPKLLPVGYGSRRNDPRSSGRSALVAVKSDHEEKVIKDTLSGMNGLHLSTSSSLSSSLPTISPSALTSSENEVLPNNSYIHHRRTVSTSNVINTSSRVKCVDGQKVYRFGGKEFVPLRMETFETGMRVRRSKIEENAVTIVKEEDRCEEESAEMEMITPKPEQPGFPISLTDYKFPSPPHSVRSASKIVGQTPNGRKSISARNDRIRATSPYHPHQLRQPLTRQDRARPTDPRMTGPGLLFRPTHRKSNSLGLTDQTIPSSSLTSSDTLLQPKAEVESNRKLILVGPAICRHLQSGGSVRVTDFSGAVVGWMH